MEFEVALKLVQKLTEAQQKELLAYVNTVSSRDTDPLYTCCSKSQSNSHS